MSSIKNTGNPDSSNTERKHANPFRLENEIALITGGGSGLGLAIAHCMAAAGARVVITGRDEDKLKQAVAAIGSQAGYVPHDVTRLSEAPALAETVQQRFGQVSILVNNAAFTGASKLSGWAVPFSQQGVEAWSAAMDINLFVPFLLTQKAAPLLAKGGAGSVVNIASIYGVAAPDFRLYEGTSMGNPAAYNASKGGLIQLTRYLATALAPEVRVNCISPGGISRGQPASFVQKYTERVPLGRMAAEEDFKGIAQLLMSDLGNYITGQNFVVDGGMTRKMIYA